MISNAFHPDEHASQPRKFLIPVDETLKTLLEREDTDQNYQITIEDSGPKVRTLSNVEKLQEELRVDTVL